MIRWPLLFLVLGTAALSAPVLHTNLRAERRVRRDNHGDRADVAAIADEMCEEGCPEDASTNCVTDCEVEMYQCVDHNRTVAADKYNACTRRAAANCVACDKQYSDDSARPVRTR
eukprot:gnl/TRDRNA2_/TRDRNA2_182586_c0_seq1.p1 gnl/TRDRNA2_/TRDRNA2_182586_c0~~gnl/TRDRNA2_/TRDRNA2_182586_c0_seq1.p1  ORF type:complete len:115 (+),score=10.36 gnl/TRDRNA2_/TRDRNA2_182586_c0_seq1:79-423(+)